MKICARVMGNIFEFVSGFSRTRMENFDIIQGDRHDSVVGIHNSWESWVGKGNRCVPFHSLIRKGFVYIVVSGYESCTALFHGRQNSTDFGHSLSYHHHVQPWNGYTGDRVKMNKRLANTQL